MSFTSTSLLDGGGTQANVQSPSTRDRSDRKTFSHVPSLATVNHAGLVSARDSLRNQFRKNTLSGIQKLKRSVAQVFARVKADPKGTAINMSHTAIHDDILAASGGLEALLYVGMVRTERKAAAAAASSDSMRLDPAIVDGPPSRLQNAMSAMDDILEVMRACVDDCVPAHHRSTTKAFKEGTAPPADPAASAAEADLASSAAGTAMNKTTSFGSSSSRFGSGGYSSAQSEGRLSAAMSNTTSGFSSGDLASSVRGSSGGRGPASPASAAAIVLSPGHRRTTAASAERGARAVFSCAARSVQVTVSKGGTAVGTLSAGDHFEGFVSDDGVWVQVLPTRDGSPAFAPLPDAAARNAVRAGCKETHYVPATNIDLVRTTGPRTKSLLLSELKTMSERKITAVASQEMRHARKVEIERQREVVRAEKRSVVKTVKN